MTKERTYTEKEVEQMMEALLRITNTRTPEEAKKMKDQADDLAATLGFGIDAVRIGHNIIEDKKRIESAEKDAENWRERAYAYSDKLNDYESRLLDDRR